MAYIDTRKVTIPKGFFEDLNVPKFLDWLNSQPTADVVKVKHGEWIYDHWCEFKCSICGHWSQTEPRGKEKYCPNCGAKMDGRKE